MDHKDIIIDRLTEFISDVILCDETSMGMKQRGLNLLISTGHVPNTEEEIEEKADPVNQMPVNLYGIPHLIPAKDYYLIKSLIAIPKKIEAIKTLRAVTGWGLKESKDAVEDRANFS